MLRNLIFFKVVKKSCCQLFFFMFMILQIAFHANFSIKNFFFTDILSKKYAILSDFEF